MKKLIKAIPINIFSFMCFNSALVFAVTMPLHFLMVLKFISLALLFIEFLTLVGVQNGVLNAEDYWAVGNDTLSDTEAIIQGLFTPIEGPTNSWSER